MRKRDVKPGYWARIRWDDVGVRDVLVIETDEDYDRVEVYTPFGTREIISYSQVVCMGPRLCNVPVF